MSEEVNGQKFSRLKLKRLQRLPLPPSPKKLLQQVNYFPTLGHGNGVGHTHQLWLLQRMFIIFFIESK